jgi:hypothetical protein
MRDLGRRLVIALGIVVAAAAAVGYAWIAGGIAQPLGVGLGSVERPSEDGALPFRLEDGRPAWIVSRDDEVRVLDARVPTAPGEPGRLVAWCGAADGVFLDVAGGATFSPDGRPLDDGSDRGLTVYPTTERDGGATLDIGRDDTVAPPASGDPGSTGCPAGAPRTTHRPAADEIFDPTVAADEEPRGWVWLEGRLTVRDGEPFLCDGLEGACVTGAPAAGIDPALIPGGEAELAGIFVGRVEDGAIDDLSVVPDLGGSS